MSLLMVRKSAPAHAADAQDAKGDEVIAQKNGYKLVYNTLNDGYWFYTKSGAGWGITATNKVAAVNEFNRLVATANDSNAEEIVNHDRIPVDQLGGEANARKHGYIIAQKGGRVYGVHIDGYSDKLAKKTIEEAGYTVVGDAAEGAAQDRGNYATNSIALLKIAIGNLRTADSVVRRAISNIGDAMDKVKDERAKSSLKSMQQEWWACEREIWAALEKVERISVPSGVGVPNKQKLSPEDRKFIEEFFE